MFRGLKITHNHEHSSLYSLFGTFGPFWAICLRYMYSVTAKRRRHGIEGPPVAGAARPSRCPGAVGESACLRSTTPLDEPGRFSRYARHGRSCGVTPATAKRRRHRLNPAVASVDKSLATVVMELFPVVSPHRKRHSRCSNHIARLSLYIARSLATV